MAYLVNLTSRASRDLDEILEARHAADSLTAARWFNGLEVAILTLENNPRRCTAAPEAKKAMRPLRHLLYGKKPHIYRIIYEIDQSGKIVHVLTIRQGAMEPADLSTSP